jgi:hypothetical protein
MKPTITDAVRRAVFDSGRGLRDLARETEIEVAQLSRFMNKKGGMSLDRLDRLAGALGLTVVRSDDTAEPKGR